MWARGNVSLWPLGAVAIHFLQPLPLPNQPTPPIGLLAGVALLRMVSCLVGAVAKRALGPKPHRPDDRTSAT